MSDAAGTAWFVSQEDPDQRLLLMCHDQWSPMPAAYKDAYAQQGVTRETLTTAAFRRDSLAGLVGVKEEDFTEETHSGVLFLTAPSGAAAVSCVGAHNGVIYLFVFSGAPDGSAFTQMRPILDQLSFE